jgi:hypothetical protein
MKKLYATTELKHVDGHRRESCKHYDDCLLKAAQKKWKSFSCRGCSDYSYAPVVIQLTGRSAPTPEDAGIEYRKLSFM